MNSQFMSKTPGLSVAGFCNSHTLILKRLEAERRLDAEHSIHHLLHTDLISASRAIIEE